jgi:hypothetical protein
MSLVLLSLLLVSRCHALVSLGAPHHSAQQRHRHPSSISVLQDASSEQEQQQQILDTDSTVDTSSSQNQWEEQEWQVLQDIRSFLPKVTESQLETDETYMKLALSVAQSGYVNMYIYIYNELCVILWGWSLRIWSTVFVLLTHRWSFWSTDAYTHKSHNTASPHRSPNQPSARYW